MTVAPSSPDALLSLFAVVADAQARAIEPLRGDGRRARTGRAGQYALDIVADEAVVPILLDAGVAVVSEESGRRGPQDAVVTVVVDPVDGSTNCARDLPYWCLSLCALDAAGPLCALVASPPTGERFRAVRGQGAWVGDTRLAPSTVTRIEDAVVTVSGRPRRPVPWRQYRALGSAALSLCAVAAGRVDGYLDAVDDPTAPWDYLGGLLVCAEAGAGVVDRFGRELVTTELSARRTVVAASTPGLLDALVAEAGA